MKGRVGHLNVCPWPFCQRLIRGGQHLTLEEAYACDQYVALPSKHKTHVLALRDRHRHVALVVNQEDFTAWEAA